MYGSGVVSATGISLFMYIRYIWWPADLEIDSFLFLHLHNAGDILSAW
jgi:hypothetical protein